MNNFEKIKAMTLEENKNLIEENERLKEELRTERIHSSQIGELEESLQHAKAENSKLKGKLDAYKMSENEANEIIAELKAENERLKANKGRCAFKCLDNTFCPEADKKITELELSRDSYKVSYETAKKYREKAEKALQEIRGYVLSLNYESKELRTIQDKINEVIGAEE